MELRIEILLHLNSEVNRLKKGCTVVLSWIFGRSKIWWIVLVGDFPLSIPCLIISFTIFQESPLWLINQSRVEEAKKVYINLHGTVPNTKFQNEMHRQV